MRVVISGGGTGGHFFPALALLGEAKDMGVETFYVGAERGIERKLESLIPSERLFLRVYPLRGVPIKERLKATGSFFKGFLKLRSCLDGEFRSLILGGYVSVPVGLATLSKGKPLYLHEQNSVPSATNRVFYMVARKVFITFEHTKRFFSGDHVIRTGLPIRKELKEAKINKKSAKEVLGFDPSSPVFLFMGGSQGAKFINSLAVEFAKKTGVQTLVITGDKDFQRMREMTEGMEKIKVFPFRTDMGVVYSAVDIAVVRAGSSTLTELSLFKIPALMIPYPHAAGDHQFYNGKEIEELGGGIVLRQEEATLERVIRAVDRIVNNHGAMSENIGKFAHPNASRVILEEVLK